jgi:hypothetical protein
MPKRSRLEVKKTLVRLSDGKNKMAAIRNLDKKVRVSNGG